MEAEETTTVLLIGYGNPGRLDDGLGPALAEAVEGLDVPGVTVDADYQLSVEDAAGVARHDVVIFADADVGGPEPFWLRPIEPVDAISFSSHSVEPQALLGLARRLFAAKTEAWVLGIRGYEFNAFGEKLSERARANLAAAVTFIESALRARDFRETPANVDQDSITSLELSDEDATCKTENM